jgi:hypothetical protein
MGTTVWGAACGTLLLLIKYVYSPQARLPGHLLLIGTIFVCLVYFLSPVTTVTSPSPGAVTSVIAPRR